MHARSVWLAGIMAVGVLLGGCSNADVPATLPDVPATPISASGPTSEESTAEPNPIDVEAEIQVFYENYARLRFDSFRSEAALSEQRRYFSDSCDSCLRAYRNAEEVLASGHSFDSSPVSTEHVSIDSIEGDVVVFNVVEDVPAAVVRDAKGEVVKEYPETPGVQTLYQARRQPGGELRIIGAEVLAS
ncbi:MAG TPA: hypothetical protein VK908_09445 [Jiangellales bacterium]|nr:hypothetical protein [Jiangellales bacterium]